MAKKKELKAGQPKKKDQFKRAVTIIKEVDKLACEFKEITRGMERNREDEECKEGLRLGGMVIGIYCPEAKLAKAYLMANEVVEVGLIEGLKQRVGAKNGMLSLGGTMGLGL